MRRVALGLCVGILAAAGIAGCGGDDDSGSDADEAAIESLSADLATYAKKGDADKFCAQFSPAQSDEMFGKTSCEKRIRPLLKGALGSFEVESIEIEGDTASVEYSNSPAPTVFVKEGGRWYLGESAGD